MRKLLIGLFLLVPIITFGQKAYTSFTISGKIIDGSTKEPIELATIIFKNSDDSKIKHGGISNSKGNFSIDVERGTYDVSVEIIGFKTKNLNISSINRNINLSVIELEIDTELLAEVEVLSEKRTIEFKANKIVYNVERDLSSSGNSATEILNNIPSVSVAPDGNVKIGGIKTPLILINGKMSSMTKNEGLKSIPAGSIENIEVIPNAGAKYAASTTGVINIILKKGEKEGLNGSITTTAGYKDYYGGLLTLNQKSKGINFYVNSTYFQRNPIDEIVTNSDFISNGLLVSSVNEKIENNSKGKGFYSTIGADFNLSSQTNLSTVLNYTNINNNNKAPGITTFINNLGQITSSNDRDFKGDFSDEIVELLIDLEHNFKKEGQQLSASVRRYSDLENFHNTIFNTNNLFSNEDFVIKNKMAGTNYHLKFNNPINKTSTFITGYTYKNGKIPFRLSGTSISSMDYTEKVNAGFIEFENEGEKFSYVLGLRGEFIELDVNYLSQDISQKKDYKFLIPSTYFQYSFSDTKSLSLSYGKSVVNPDYNRLQPFEQKISETSSYKGNVHLNPIITNNIELLYAYSGEKITFAPTIFFMKIDEYWEFVTYETGETINGISKILTKPYNVGNLDYYGINLTSSYKVSNILNFTGFVSIFNMTRKGKLTIKNELNENINKDYEHSSLSGEMSLLFQLKIPGVFDIQSNIQHVLESEARYSIRKAYTNANLAINKDLFNKDASISLSVDDLFLSEKTDRNRFETNYFSNTLNKSKHRNILLSFTYRFNQSKKDRKIDFEIKENKPKF
ncbi:outer membrane beta-barrel protein [Lutibacter sp.]|uniref:outer membrane beta-barrel protein n=1 Tax=Lutibacter sp. TaxID=1925666 RepID=UPI0027345B05|nr:outer membrane beta-barrel protein [Lutibacter sp.]MDP3312351.1 TonB-dependent receptor [Lutibacter sp.]